MYAIIENSGQQFKVSEGDVLRIDLMDGSEPSQAVEFDRVLLVADGKDIKVGTPLVDGAKVTGEVVVPKVAGVKVVSFRYRRRKGYHRRKGHRQKYTEVRITKIVA